MVMTDMRMTLESVSLQLSIPKWAMKSSRLLQGKPCMEPVIPIEALIDMPGQRGMESRTQQESVLL